MNKKQFYIKLDNIIKKTYSSSMTTAHILLAIFETDVKLLEKFSSFKKILEQYSVMLEESKNNYDKNNFLLDSNSYIKEILCKNSSFDMIKEISLNENCLAIRMMYSLGIDIELFIMSYNSTITFNSEIESYNYCSSFLLDSLKKYHVQNSKEILRTFFHFIFLQKDKHTLQSIINKFYDFWVYALRSLEISNEKHLFWHSSCIFDEKSKPNVLKNLRFKNILGMVRYKYPLCILQNYFNI